MLSSSSLLAWSLALPAVVCGVFIETNVLNTTSLVCATRYASTSLDGAIPTVTFEGHLNHGPIIFHTTTTPVETITPKPVNTKTTKLVTNTTWITTTPVDNVWNSTSTVLETSTSWHHTTVTETELVKVIGTSRSTVWIPVTTGFKPIRDTKSGWAAIDVEEPKFGHPHRARDVDIASPVSTRCRRPLASKFPAAVDCTERIEFSTTQIVIATQRWTLRTTLPAETTYKTTTVYAVITSTVLSASATATAFTERSNNAKLRAPAIPGLVSRNSKYRDWLNFFGNHGEGAKSPLSQDSAEDPATAAPAVSEDKLALVVSYPAFMPTEKGSPSASPSSPPTRSPTSSPGGSSSSPTGIITNTRTRTLTPFTVTATWTGTSTLTSTHYMNATHTITALAACATENLLYVDSNQKRINGIAANIKGVQTEHAIPGIKNAYECCAACVAGDLECAFSLFELEGSEKGRCVLYVDEQSGVGGQQVMMGGDAGLAEGEKDGRQRKCLNQRGNMGVFSFRSRNGETAFVASNGYCGYLGDGDVVFP